MINAPSLTRLFPLLFLFLLVGCASQAPRPLGEDDVQSRAARVAAGMIGKPYRYGGRSPAGFDCSGLVYYSFYQAGMEVPRSTSAQVRASRSVAMADLRLGDLLFFHQDGRKSGHVGIYLGDGQFVHAPSRGKQVRTDQLSDPYWQKHFASARRFPSL